MLATERTSVTYVSKTEELMTAEKENLKTKTKNLSKRRQDGHSGHGREEHRGWTMAQSVKHLP